MEQKQKKITEKILDKFNPLEKRFAQRNPFNVGVEIMAQSYVICNNAFSPSFLIIA
jgi:hypothetical protein